MPRRGTEDEVADMRMGALSSVSKPSKATVRATARARASGAVMVEYALLLVFVVIPVFIGITTGGLEMLRDYQEGRAKMIRNYP